MTTLFQLSVVETTYEDQAYGWTYRFIESFRGVLVKRTATNNQVWNNSSLMQVFSVTKGEFVPSNESIGYFPTLDSAKSIIGEFAINEVY